MTAVHMTKGLAVMLMVCLATIAQAQAPTNDFPNQAAYDVLQLATDKLLNKVVDNHVLYVADTDVFFSDVDDLLSSIIDFQRIARRVMARHYKKAELEQQIAFKKAFKHSLLNVYAKALLDYSSERIVILPPTGNQKINLKRQRVEADFYSAAGRKIPVTYAMYLNKDSQWKIENIIVNGINIGLTYRNQFSRLMKANNNDVDRVITGWRSGLELDG
jgi:phospholipid transport system substrate-binding protein